MSKLGARMTTLMYDDERVERGQTRLLLYFSRAQITFLAIEPTKFFFGAREFHGEDLFIIIGSAVFMVLSTYFAARRFEKGFFFRSAAVWVVVFLIACAFHNPIGRIVAGIIGLASAVLEDSRHYLKRA